MTTSKPRIRAAALALLGIVAVVAIAAGFRLATPTYSARSLLQVSASPPKVLFETADRDGDSLTSLANYQKTQEQLIKSRFVLDQALKHPSVAKLPAVVRSPDPAGWLAEELSITFVGEVLYIGLESDTPEGAVELVNAVTDAYLNQVVEVEHDRRKHRLAQLTRIHDDYQARLKDRREMLGKLAEAAGGTDRETSSLRRQLLHQELSEVARESLRVDLETGEAEARLERKKAAADGGEDARAAIAALEERLAVLARQGRLLDERERRLFEEARSLGREEPRRDSPGDDLGAVEEAARRIGAEVEALKIELDAPPRIRLVEKAAVATRR